MATTGKYHINPHTGRVGKCTAVLRPCEFMPEDKHFESKEEAQKALEQSLKHLTLPSTKKPAAAKKQAPKKSPITAKQRAQVEKESKALQKELRFAETDARELKAQLSAIQVIIKKTENAEVKKPMLEAEAKIKQQEKDAAQQVQEKRKALQAHKRANKDVYAAVEQERLARMEQDRKEDEERTRLARSLGYGCGGGAPTRIC